jgi:iron complex transport system substrate-binding protein
MKNNHPRLAKAVITLIILSALFMLYRLSPSTTNKQESQQETKQTIEKTNQNRIISLAPSITETLYSLGLIDDVVGVTRFCKYPPSATSITNVGGYSDPSFETMVALQPTLIISLNSHKKVRKQLAPFKIQTITLNNRSIEGIINSIQTIGRVTNKNNTASTLINSLRTEIKEIDEQTKKLNKPSVLITVGRQLDSKQISEIIIAGHDGFYSEMITIAGGKNAYTGDIAFPTLSGEGIISLNPDIIIDIIPNPENTALNKVVIINQWKISYDISATKNNRIHVLDDNYMVIPGPRFIKIIRQLVKIFHPNIEGEGEGGI